MERRGRGGDCSNQDGACVDLFRVCVCVCVSEVRGGGGAKSNFYSLVSLSLHPSFFPVPMLFP